MESALSRAVDVGDDMAARPYPRTELPTDVCRQPMRPLNPRKPGGVIAFPGQLTVGFPVCSCGIFAHVHRRTPSPVPSFVHIVNQTLRVNSHIAIFTKSPHYPQLTERRQLSTCQFPHARAHIHIHMNTHPRSPRTTYGGERGRRSKPLRHRLHENKNPYCMRFFLLLNVSKPNVSVKRHFTTITHF